MFLCTENDVYMKKIKKIVLIAVTMIVLAFTFNSCSPEFNEGFRQGWNMTAPEEWRY